MKEKPFEKQVRKFLKSEDCYCRKIWGGGYQTAGLPDLIICCNGYFIAVEVKSDNGEPTELQLHNIEEIKQAGGIGIVLYPKNFEEFKKLIYKLKGR